MPPKSITSKVFAVAFIVLTILVISAVIAMIVVYSYQIKSLAPTEPPPITTTTPAPPPRNRLPKNVVPERYEIVLQPQFYTEIPVEVNGTGPNQTMLFNGTSTVYFHCLEETKTIYLNSVDLKIEKSLVMHKGREIKSSYILPNESNIFLEVELTESLKAGENYSLFLAFQGDISRNLESLFISTYVDGANTERYLVATNMQPTEARNTFPCFDEPEMKAVFHVTIIHREGTKALGNMKSNSNRKNGWEHTEFVPTPRMSTYLFAFAVSEFTSVKSPGREEIMTYARPEATAAGETQYAANITVKILDFYETYFGIKYNLGKLDQIALPDLYPEAMENWGLITYQEGSLLYKEGVSSLLHKEVVTSLIAHELAHQWFGNLVTMKWWNEVWLNEGFATYMTYFAVDAAEPSFKIKDVLIMKDLHRAFMEDALESSHPLSVPVQDVQTSYEISEMFDAITYNKGAMVLRMLTDYVKESVFQKGITAYLKAFKYENTDQNDLWKYIQEAYDENDVITIEEFMHPWTSQTGYPVVTINTTNGVTTQKRFLFNDTAESRDLWWPIRINYMTNSSDSASLWLNAKGQEPEAKTDFISKDGDWILANVNCTGYYRVNYDAENWARLLTQLETNLERIPVMNRGQLVDDAFSLARAKLVSVTLALNATRFLRKETSFLPWESAVKNLEYFVLMFDRSEVYGPIQVYLQEQVRGLYNYFKNLTDVSEVPEDHSLQYNQLIAIEVACSNGLAECEEMAAKQYADWMNNSTINNFTVQQ
ncbi:aminopeptidase N-like isoform X2 [Mugil cephalus]|uniref:aminopeptidase N-like isoform X2 n=1 Tax=Mugil cephalus TaxID=48193 RepID=UPI001FB5F2EF|nr:aminopeptidase N-like isoform X2 [Mugil cephalus]